MSTLTAREIYQGLAQRRTCLYLYNPSDKPIQGRFDSHDYTLPPANEAYIKVKKGKVVDQYHEPGVLPVYGYVTSEEKLNPKEAEKHPEVKTIEITPEAICAHLVGEDGLSGQLGPLGVRRLVGDPELDSVLKEDARRTWLLKQYEDDVALITAHEQVVAVAAASAKPTPFLTPRVREAMRRRAKYEQGGGDDYAKFVCPKCGDRLKEEMDVRAHVTAYHTQHAVDILGKLGIGALEVRPDVSPVVDEELPSPVKRGPGRPRKEAQ